VLHALTLDTASRQRWVEQRFWKPLRPAVYEFAGATGTGVFEAMRAGEWTYHRFVATA
jgi:hypothetical protein